jgi:hypothetical protein
MRLYDLINEEVLKKHEHGFGFSEYEGSIYSLVGGSRSGSSSAGLTRLKYDIIDRETMLATDNYEQSKRGYVELFVNNSGGIDGLVNIVLPVKGRKQGLGASVIKDLVDTAGGQLKIYDIQPKAKGFWKKVGAELTKRGSPYDAIITN